MERDRISEHRRKWLGHATSGMERSRSDPAEYQSYSPFFPGPVDNTFSPLISDDLPVRGSLNRRARASGIRSGPPLSCQWTTGPRDDLFPRGPPAQEVQGRRSAVPRRLVVPDPRAHLERFPSATMRAEGAFGTSHGPFRTRYHLQLPSRPSR